MEDIKIIFAGDYSPVNKIEKLALGKQYDKIYNDLLPILKDKDFSVVSIEGVFTTNAEKINKTGPNIKINPKVINAVKYADFDLVALGNNHILDYGYQGFRETLDICKSVNLDYFGVGNNINEARKIYYKSIKGLNLAFINICENEFSTAKLEKAGANPLNSILNYYDIKEASANSDYVFVIYHGGNENYKYASPRIKELFRFYIDCGANVVLGTHPHIYGGYEKYKNGLIFYSLGNFIFDWFLDSSKMINKPWNYGYIVKLLINNYKIDFKLIPYEQCSAKIGTILLKNDNKEKFLKELEFINKINSNNKLISELFEEFCKKKTKIYLLYLQPYLKLILRIILKIFSYKIINNKNYLLILNIIRNESHRDVLLKILEQITINKKK